MLSRGARNKREVRAIFEVMAYLVGAIDGTPSMIDEVDDEDGIPIGSPNRIGDVAKSTMEDTMSRPEMQCHANSKNPDESSAEILALLRSPSWNAKDVMGHVDKSERQERKRNHTLQLSAIPSHNLSFQPCLILPVVTYLSHRTHPSAIVSDSPTHALAQDCLEYKSVI